MEINFPFDWNEFYQRKGRNRIYYVRSYIFYKLPIVGILCKYGLRTWTQYLTYYILEWAWHICDKVASILHYRGKVAYWAKGIGHPCFVNMYKYMEAGCLK